MRAGKLIAAVATVACWAAMPASAHAAPVSIGEIATGAVERVNPAAAAAAAAPVSGALPGPTARHPVHAAVAPVADVAAPAGRTATESLPTAAAASQARFGEQARQPVRRISASTSAGRMSSERDAHGYRHQGESGRPSSEPVAPAHRPAAVSVHPAPDAPGAVGSGAPAGSFFLGGGFALLVASLLLLAGPRLRRRLSLPPAVCRPAAFLLVLERPG